MKINVSRKTSPINHLLFLTLILIYTVSAQAEFLPSEVALVCNENTKSSCELAKYYAEVRNVPSHNIISIKTSSNEAISREEYNQEILIPIKKALAEKDLISKALVLVTFYGVPLKINENSSLENSESLKLQLSARSRELKAKTLAGLQKLKMIGGSASKDLPINLESLTSEYLTTLINNAKTTLANAKSDRKALESLMQTITDLIGLKGVLANSPNIARDMGTQITKQIVLREKKLEAINTPSNSEKLDSYLTLQKDLLGTLGLIRVSNLLADSLFAINSEASVDSELTLLKIQPGGAPISNKINNPLFTKDISSKKNEASNQLSAIKRLLLVSRLDASSPELVKTIIKNTIETEKEQSLKGNFLIDSRGIPWEQKDAYAERDKSLVQLARKIEVGDRFEVEFDGNDILAEKTKDVALYVGWYQLRQYENLYSFKKGSIGFHIASEEAVSLRNPEEKGWCKNLLDNGVVATLGAVSEPYLDAFPKPYEFFTLLLSGKYQLVEIYYMTSTHLSWKMVLVGDPLYKPISEKTARNEFDYDTEDFNDMPVSPSILMRH